MKSQGEAEFAVRGLTGGAAFRRPGVLVTIDEQPTHLTDDVTRTTQASQQHGAVAADDQRTVTAAYALGDRTPQRRGRNLQAVQRPQSATRIPLRPEYADVDVTGVADMPCWGQENSLGPGTGSGEWADLAVAVGR